MIISCNFCIYYSSLSYISTRVCAYKLHLKIICLIIWNQLSLTNQFLIGFFCFRKVKSMWTISFIFKKILYNYRFYNFSFRYEFDGERQYIVEREREVGGISAFSIASRLQDDWVQRQLQHQARRVQQRWRRHLHSLRRRRPTRAGRRPCAWRAQTKRTAELHRGGCSGEGGGGYSIQIPAPFFRHYQRREKHLRVCNKQYHIS